MRANPLSAARSLLHRTLRRGFALLPRDVRFALYRHLVNCDANPSDDLEVKIAETREELEDCFRILHDAYVASGFMQPDPSGLRVTAWHALPTTTTICAKVRGEVVGTLSMVREGVFGLPMQSAFDLTPVRKHPGQLVELSALAVRHDFRRTGGAVLFPLMKFMYEYCTWYFDTRHLLIAVNPNRIELYESLLLFQRLQANVIEHYSFANGAPAIGAALDLQVARGQFHQLYSGRKPQRDLHRYFVQTQLRQLHLPQRRYFTTNDPVMTAELLDYFFNQRTQGFAKLDARQRQLLHEIYDGPEFAAILPPVAAKPSTGHPLRGHRRHSIKCEGTLRVRQVAGRARRLALTLVEISSAGCLVDVGAEALALGTEGELEVYLGMHDPARVRVRVVRRAGQGGPFYGLEVRRPDDAWVTCVEALAQSTTYVDICTFPPQTAPLPLAEA